MVVRFSLVQFKTSVTLDAPAAYIVYDGLGFRVPSLLSSAAAVPEPTSMAIFGLEALGKIILSDLGIENGKWRMENY